MSTSEQKEKLRDLLKGVVADLHVQYGDVILMNSPVADGRLKQLDNQRILDMDEFFEIMTKHADRVDIDDFELDFEFVTDPFYGDGSHFSVETIRSIVVHLDDGDVLQAVTIESQNLPSENTEVPQ